MPPQQPPQQETTWQERLIAEEKTLSDNLQKLLDFIASADFQKISNDQQMLLQQQREAMQLYDQILERRIKSLNLTT